MYLNRYSEKCSTYSNKQLTMKINLQPTFCKKVENAKTSKAK